MGWLADAAVWIEVYIAVEWLIRLSMLAIVPLRRSPQAALAWLLVVLLVPIPGLLLFLLLGRSKVPAWRLQRLEDFREAMTELRHQLLPQELPSSAAVDPELAPTAVLAHNLGRFRVLGGNQVELLADYQIAIDRLIADIEAATNHVHLLYYIFADDGATAPVVAALGRAVERGVACRVLFDAVGSRPWGHRMKRKLAAVGVEVHAVLPWGLFHRRAARVDLRNHRKIAVIDGRIGYVGSQNLVDSKFIAGLSYEELVVRLTGPAVLQLQYVFASDWFVDANVLLSDARYFPPPQATGDVAIQVLPSGPHSPHENNQRLIVSLVHSARQRIVVTTPYFVPDEPLLQALETAAVRGVDVKLILSHRTDNWLVRMAQESYYDELFDAGIQVHRYEPQFLHSKCLSVDGEVVLVGSSNMDIRSFRLNSEISILIYDRDVAARLRDEEERYLGCSHQLVRDRWGRISRLRRVMQGIARLLSPLL